jgi:putative ABC transport system permease protein
VRWWRRLLSRDLLERQLDAELREHLERQVADYVHEGMGEDEARRRAQVEFGGLDQVKEDCRDARGTRWVEELVRDVRQAGRVLGRQRRFTAAATLAVALGIGTNLTFFSLVHAVLLQTLPYREPARLVSLSEFHPERGRYGKVSGADFQEWTERAHVFEGLACYWDRGYTLTGGATPESLVGWQLSSNLFGLLGAPALLGRTLQPEDGRPGRDDVVVISEALWRRRFAGSPAALGQSLVLDGRPHTIVGVMPREYAHPPGRTDVWTPLVLEPGLLADREHHPLRVIARLKRGVTIESARADLAAMAGQLARAHPASNAEWKVDLRPIRDLYVGDVRTLLWLMQGAVFLLLVIACANVANLTLTRAAAREREIAVRVALGARPGHLLREFLAEGLLVAAGGGAAGLVLAAWGVQVVPHWLGDQLGHLPLPETVSGWFGPSVLLATAGATVVVGLVLGAVPLVHGLRLTRGPLEGKGRGLTDTVRTRRLRNAFVVTQVALSVCLLVGAGLLVRSFARLQERPLGLRTEGVLTAQLVLPPNRYAGLPETAVFLARLVERLRALPGVDAAGLVNAMPLTGSNARRPYQVAGVTHRDQVADFRVVTPQYFAAMGIPVTKGRVFEDRDRSGAEEVVIVNEALARRLSPAGDLVGRQIVVPDMATPAARTIVGVVGNVRHHGLATEPDPEIYRPAYQAYWPFFGIAIRLAAGAPPMAESLRAAVSSLDKDMAVTDVRWLDERANDAMTWRRSSMALLGLFAACALLLASFGVYGVVSFAVVQRHREIGLRMALGAAPGAVVRSFLARGATLAAAGIALGLGASALLTQALEALLFGVARLDSVTYAAAAGLALIVTAVSTVIPALAAAGVDPTEALRAE